MNNNTEVISYNYHSDHRKKKSKMDHKSSPRGEESKGHKSGISRVDSEDGSVLVVNDDTPEETTPVSKLRMGTLDLSLAADSKNHTKLSIKDEPDIQEQELLVIFDLPDGSQGEQSFKLGQTVEVLKSFVESEYGIPMMEQKLFLDVSSNADGKELHNPFSLLDYADIKGKPLFTADNHLLCAFSVILCENMFAYIGCEEIYVRVEGDLPKFSKK